MDPAGDCCCTNAMHLRQGWADNGSMFETIHLRFDSKRSVLFCSRNWVRQPVRQSRSWHGSDGPPSLRADIRTPSRVKQSATRIIDLALAAGPCPRLCCFRLEADTGSAFARKCSHSAFNVISCPSSAVRPAPIARLERCTLPSPKTQR